MQKIFILDKVTVKDIKNKFRNELKNLYSTATPEEKTQIVAVLKKIDPTNSTKYEEILN